MTKFLGFPELCLGPLNLRFLGPPGPGPRPSWPMGKCITDSLPGLQSTVGKVIPCVVQSVVCK